MTDTAHARFVCASCGGTFNNGLTDEEAAAESRKVFGVDITQDPTMVVVCDDCYQAMTTAMPSKEWLLQQVVH